MECRLVWNIHRKFVMFCSPKWYVMFIEYDCYVHGKISMFPVQLHGFCTRIKFSVSLMHVYVENIFNCWVNKTGETIFCVPWKLEHIFYITDKMLLSIPQDYNIKSPVNWNTHQVMVGQFQSNLKSGICTGSCVHFVEVHRLYTSSQQSSVLP